MGPLAGIKIVELTGIGPGPMCAMLLADLGATVLRIDRPKPSDLGVPRPLRYDLLLRGRQCLALDLKHPEGKALALRLIERADALIEGFRPGVTERLGLGPEHCFARNPRLVYGRVTGWGQEGPLAQAAGHDLNYIALAGAVHAFGRQGQPPTPPLNLIGDFGGGALYLAFGVVCGILEAQRSGKGQVVDAAMVDGAALLLGGIYGMVGAGLWDDSARGANMLDGGAHFYGTYETKDGKFVSIGSIEPQFYDELLEKTGLKGQNLPPQRDRNAWAQLRSRLEAIFRTKTRDEWCTIMEGSDVCFAPVLTMKEASQHPHAKARGAYVDVEGFPQPAAAPRFSRTKESVKSRAAKRGEHTDQVLGERGFSSKEIGELKSAGIVGAQ
jgi:alpha-methylacyl-CoA racemase